MIRSKLGGLVLLNTTLLGALALVSLSPNPAAIADGQSASRGEYVAISGTIAGTKTPVIWVVNQASQELVAFHNSIASFGFGDAERPIGKSQLGRVLLQRGFGALSCRDIR